jgi:hypothetical protein
MAAVGSRWFGCPDDRCVAGPVVEQSGWRHLDEQLVEVGDEVVETVAEAIGRSEGHRQIVGHDLVGGADDVAAASGVRDSRSTERRPLQCGLVGVLGRAARPIQIAADERFDLLVWIGGAGGSMGGSPCAIVGAISATEPPGCSSL